MACNCRSKKSYFKITYSGGGTEVVLTRDEALKKIETRAGSFVEVKVG